MRAAVTFDFHNTLIQCDPWFDLEVAELPGQVARMLAVSDAAWQSVADQELKRTYRALRAEIIAHGNELDAVAGVIETFRRLGLEATHEAICEIVDASFRELVSETSVMAGVSETLEYLHERGLVIGVISSAAHHEFLEWALTFHGLRGYLTDVVTSASTGFYKSRPEIYHVACKRLGTTPASTIHIGDSFRFDHLGGRAAGLRTVWINDIGTVATIGEPPPSLEIASLIGAGPKIHELMIASSYAN
jgi:HAD superfamily hydrolase (TIGR01549 family)